MDSLKREIRKTELLDKVINEVEKRALSLVGKRKAVNHSHLQDGDDEFGPPVVNWVRRLHAVPFGVLQIHPIEPLAIMGVMGSRARMGTRSSGVKSRKIGASSGVSQP